MARAIAALRAGLSLSKACDAVAQAFHGAGIESPQLDARALVCHALGIDRSKLVVDSERALLADEAAAIDAAAARRLAREPVARIIGRKEFWSLPLHIAPAVLVPRPDTETVVEAALDAMTANGGRRRPIRILDIGTGSGALLLALLSELPNAFGIGTDLSHDATTVARDNANRLSLDGRCAFIVCDVAAALRGPFDLVVSNPPYIPSGDIPRLAPEVRSYDPGLALDGGTDGLDAYRAIAADARRLLAPQGALALELGIGQEAGATELLTTAGMAVPHPARRDLGGIARALLAYAP